MEEQLDLKFIIEKAGVKEAFVVAEFGCGSGHLSRSLARVVGNKGIVYAVDVLKDALLTLDRMANLDGLQNIKTIWSNLEIYGATNIKDKSVDVGFIVNTFFQSNREKDFLEEVLRTIKPDGKVVVVDWKDEATSIIAPANENRTGIEKLEKICKDLKNIKIEEVFNLGDTHYGAIIIKK